MMAKNKSLCLAEELTKCDCEEEFVAKCGLRKLCPSYRTFKEHDREVMDKFFKAVFELLDESTREAFADILGKKRYGSFSLIFKAGECIGFDWKSSHRTH